MITIEDIIRDRRAKNIKPSDEELRHLPFKNAFIYPRLSSPAQVRESHESVHEIAELVRLAKEDGYRSDLVPADVEEWLLKIQRGIAEKGVWTNEQITIDLSDLGISGRLQSNDRPGLRHLQDSIAEGRTGTVYVSEASRLTRDQTRITPFTLLELFKAHSCRIRTPEYIKNPRIQKDWDDLADELEEGIQELKVMARRLNRKRRQKAERGEYVGGPVPPGFIVEIKETEPSGRHIYGKYRRYPPHAEMAERILREYIKQGFSEMRTHRALEGLMYPLFPPELNYMERLSSLRKATKIEGVGYRISPSMISSLATTPELIGIWTWGDIEPIPDNHDKAVPVELWLEAYQGAINSIKPRGRGIRHEPLEWDGILRCCDHDIPQRISGHAAKGAYRCQSDYVQGRGPACFDLTARYLDEPLTKTVLRQLDFTPFAEEVLMQLEADTAHSNLEMEQIKKDIAKLQRRMENLEEQLGWEGGVHDQHLLKQIERTQGKLEELKVQPAPTQPLPATSYQVVKDFLTGLPDKWYTYSRTLRNRLLKRLVDHVDVRHKGQLFEATIYWRTGQSEVVCFRRPRAKGRRESRWTEEELGILKKLWPDASQDKTMAALPQRTWKAITHQAYNLGLRRSPELSNRTPRRRWEPNEEAKARQLYEAGTPITDIASNIGRSYTAVLQRSWEKGWQRPHSDQRMAVTELSNTNQNPEVSKRITSGSIFGARSPCTYAESSLRVSP